MIRKEKVLIGTESEIRDYYLNQLKQVKTDKNGKVTHSYSELKPFESQVKQLNNGFGLIFYFKIKGPKLVVERMFVWITPEVKNEPVG